MIYFRIKISHLECQSSASMCTNDETNTNLSSEPYLNQQKDAHESCTSTYFLVFFKLYF